ncbi:hypothetical protein DPMN_099942 [Dreissena polymorpha]|uniref:Uncharacterized protein n=1 Tax=Dreissena polymorpha TaxID=45954 RepID=A0A9D4LFU1_DREPO|nr:hypothetical protein DPMN_099942 [Dreissena polymorpha]
MLCEFVGGWGGPSFGTGNTDRSHVNREWGLNPGRLGEKRLDQIKSILLAQTTALTRQQQLIENKTLTDFIADRVASDQTGKICGLVWSCADRTWQRTHFCKTRLNNVIKLL